MEEENKKLIIQQIFNHHGVEHIGFTPFDVVKMNEKRLPMEGIKTVIITYFPYLPPSPIVKTDLSIYARLPDYHTVIKNLLDPIVRKLHKQFEGYNFQSFADNSPVQEVKAAVLAGLGCIGKNGLLITPEYGSYVFIGGILTDMPFSIEEKVPSTCSSCGKCIAVCPTGALSSSGFDCNRCLSHITQKKGMLSQDEQGFIRNSGMVWGCDECQLACPMNATAKPTTLPEFVNKIHSTLTAEDLDTDLSDRAFIWHGKEVLKRNLDILK